MENFLVIENLFSKEFCKNLVETSEKIGYAEADISYSSGAKMNKEYRNNDRLLYENEGMRSFIEHKLKEYTPNESTLIGEGGTLHKVPFLRLSGKFRLYRYTPGQKFKKHRDSNQLEEGGVSLYTVLVYLNECNDGDGGETSLYIPGYEDKIMVRPSIGNVLIFDHSIAHTGEELKNGVKYVLRTDFIYKP